MEKIGNEPQQIDPWNKVFFKIMAWYPSWKPDSLVSAAWKDELGHFPHEQILNAVRAIANENPSPYPPQVFQIQRLLVGTGPRKLVANEEWERVKRAAGPYSPRELMKRISDHGRRVVDAMGGFQALDRMTVNDEPFFRKRFVELFEELATSASQTEMLASGQKTNAAKSFPDVRLRGLAIGSKREN